MHSNDMIRRLTPPKNRAGKSDGPHEHHFDEGAVMLAYAIHLLRTTTTTEIHIHPDGMHGKYFDFSENLCRRGFVMSRRSGKTAYGGTYVDEQGRKIIISPRPGLGDVVTEVEGITVSAECKGGIINTRHAGQVSRLNKGLCENIGRLMASPSHGRQVAVVPFTEHTLRLAKKLAPRCSKAGIEIALIDGRGEVFDIRPS